MKVKAFFLCRQVLPSGNKDSPHLSEAALTSYHSDKFPDYPELFVFMMVGHEPNDVPGERRATLSFVFGDKKQFERSFDVHMPTDDAVEWTSLKVRLSLDGPGVGRFFLTFEDADAAADWPLRVLYGKSPAAQ